MFLSEWREFPSAPSLEEKKKLDNSSRLDVVEISHVPDMLSSLFPSWFGLRTYQHPDNISGKPVSYLHRCENLKSSGSKVRAL